jgi:hypothetical protein
LALASIPGMKLGEYQFVVELKSPTLSPQLLRTLEAEGDLYKAWSKKMIHFIYDVIERIIMFDSEVISTNMPEPVKKSRKYNPVISPSPFSSSSSTIIGVFKLSLKLLSDFSL